MKKFKGYQNYNEHYTPNWESVEDVRITSSFKHIYQETRNINKNEVGDQQGNLGSSKRAKRKEDIIMSSEISKTVNKKQLTGLTKIAFQVLIRKISGKTDEAKKREHKHSKIQERKGKNTTGR